MPIQIECPGCNATLLVADELAGRQGKCIHCGHRVTVPAKASGNGLSPTVFEATPEAMVRELFRRQQSAVLLVFPTPQNGSYDLAEVADADLKCIATEDINQPRFAQLVASFAKRFGPRKKGGPQPLGPTTDAMLFELKGDRLGMILSEFKQKYHRQVEGGHKLPLCSDTAFGKDRASLQTEPWHLQAGIVHARVDLPAEDNSPTVAGVKTELLLYQFVDGKLYRIAALFPTDQFHVVSDAAVKKYGPVTRETPQPRQLVWENSFGWVSLLRGSVHPREASVLELVHRDLQQIAASRVPTGAADI